MRETLPEKLFQELGLETLKSQPWFRKLSLFHKIFHSKLPGYLYQKITTHMLHEVLLTIKFLSFNIKTNFLQDSFLPAAITEQNNLDISIRNSSSCHVFKKFTTV